MIRSLIGDGANRQRQVVVGLAVVGGAALIAVISLLGPKLWRDGEDAVVAQDLLDFEQVHAGLDEVRGIAVPQAVRGDLFFSPQEMAT